MIADTPKVILAGTPKVIVGIPVLNIRHSLFLYKMQRLGSDFRSENISI